MIKTNILLAFSALIVLTLNSQAQVQSPYSQYGIGDMTKTGFGQSRAMGGIGIGLRTKLHLNNSNPAGLTALDTSTVIYELGFSGTINETESSTGADTRSGSAIDYIAFGFRVKKMWYATIGMQPLSSSEYIFKSSNFDYYVGTVNNYYAGQGGLNKIYWTNAFAITENISAGLNINYNFGAIDRIKAIQFADDKYASPSKSMVHSQFYGFTLDYGLQYNIDVEADYNLCVGLVYANSLPIHREYSTLAGKINASSDRIVDYTNANIVDTTIFEDEKKESFSLPQKLGVGFTWSKKNKYTIGADIEYLNFDNFKFDSFDEKLTNGLNFKTGLEYIPDHKSVTRFFKRASYRFGGHFEKTNIKNISDYGISFGVGLPLGRSKTSLNIAFDLGQRGPLNNDLMKDEYLLKETYGILSLNLSLSDVWFLKRKYK